MESLSGVAGATGVGGPPHSIMQVVNKFFLKSRVAGATLLRPSSVLLGLLGLAVLPFLLLCFYNQPYIDDYGLANLARQHGVWRAQYLLYHQLNGRFVSSFLLTVLNPLTYGWASGTRLASLTVDVATLLALWFGFGSLLRPAIGQRQQAVLTAVSFLVFVAIIPDVYSALYWFASQAVHQLASLLLVMVPVSVGRAQQAGKRRTARWGWLGAAAVGTCLVGGSGELVTVLLGWLLLVASGLSGWRRQYQAAGIWGGLLLLLVGAALLDSTAPSNLHRLHPATTDAAGIAAKLRQLWQPAWLVRAIKLLLWQPGTLLILVVPVLFYPLAGRVVAVRPAGFRLPLLASGGILLLGVLLGAFLMQLEISTSEIVPRCANVLLWWLLLGWLAACWAALPAAAPPLIAPIRAARTISILLLSVLITVPVSRAWRELLVEAPAWNRQCQARYAFLRQVAARRPHSKLELPPIRHVTPRFVLLRTWYDVAPIYQAAYNRELAQYFGVDSVRVNPAISNPRRAAF